MPELYEVIEALARAASTTAGWMQGDAELIAEWIEGERSPAPKPAQNKASGGKAS